MGNTRQKWTWFGAAASAVALGAVVAVVATWDAQNSRTTGATRPVLPGAASRPTSRAAHRQEKDGAVVVERGFVFIEGRYVSLPYRLRVRDDAVLLNGHVVRRLPQRLNVTMPDGAEDPGVPDWVNADTTLGELAADEEGRPLGLVFRKWAFLARTRPPREAAEAIIEYLESLPCVSEVQRSSPIEDKYWVSVSLTSHEGETLALWFLPPAEKGTPKEYPATPTTHTTTAPASPEMRQLFSARDHFVRLLSRNCALFFCNHAQSLTKGETNVARNLPAAVSVVQSDMTLEEKEELIRKLGIYPATREFIDGFRPSKELTERLEELEARTGIAPATIEEVRQRPSIETLLRR